jgi:hypothetical protein
MAHDSEAPKALAREINHFHYSPLPATAGRRAKKCPAIC